VASERHNGHRRVDVVDFNIRFEEDGLCCNVAGCTGRPTILDALSTRLHDGAKEALPRI
jgi:hypothetical protein